MADGGQTSDAAVSDEIEVTRLTSDQWVAMRDADSLRIGEKVRGLALGVLAFCWVIVSSDKGIGVTVNAVHHRWIYVTGCIAVLSLLLDLLHTLSHFVQIERGVELFLADRGDEAGFDYGGWLYRSQIGFFWLKVLSSIAACGSLAGLLLITMR